MPLRPALLVRPQGEKQSQGGICLGFVFLYRDAHARLRNRSN